MIGLTIDPAVGVLVSGALALLFANAAFHKVRDLAGFADVFVNYGLLPQLSRWHLTWGVPVLEAGVAIALLLPGSRQLAAATGALLLLCYAAAIAINLHAGRTSLSCGCGLANEGQPIARWMVVRNVLLALLLGLAWRPWRARSLEWTDLVTIVAGIAATSLLYVSLERLLALPRRGLSNES